MKQLQLSFSPIRTKVIFFFIGGILGIALFITPFIYAQKSNLSFTITNVPTHLNDYALSSSQVLTSQAPLTIGTFSSSALGITFQYVTSNISSTGQQEYITPLIIGNKVYMHDSLAPYTNGNEFVQVFSKSPTESFDSFLQSSVLKNYSSHYCQERTNVSASVSFRGENSYQTAGIFYSKDAIGGDGDDIIYQCPEPYTNLLDSPDITLFFLMDMNHPSKVLFFEIFGSSDPIVGSIDGQMTWDQTIQIL